MLYTFSLNYLLYCFETDFQNRLSKRNGKTLKWGGKTGSKSRTKTEGDEKSREKQQQDTYHSEREEILTRQDRIMPELVISLYDYNTVNPVERA